MTVNRDRELKLLGLRSGGVCAFVFGGKACRKPLTAINPDDDSIVLRGQGAHIVAQADSGPRGDPTMTPGDRDRAENQMWLCTQHHQLVDSASATFTAERLLAMRSAHEEWVRLRTESGD